ncbi:hypothetical protein CHARACLAT_033059, partial [Characodon lateralis]|nr:hypothetical protein [Characodon lateralis]
GNPNELLPPHHNLTCQTQSLWRYSPSPGKLHFFLTSTDQQNPDSLMTPFTFSCLSINQFNLNSNCCSH